jgi:hypothetical protein
MVGQRLTAWQKLAVRWCVEVSVAFSNGADGSNGIRRSSVLYLAHVFQQAVIELIDEFDGDEPYHWAQFCLRECAV